MAGAPLGSRPSRRAAHRPRPTARRRLREGAPRRARGARGARGAQAARLPQDLGLARDPRVRARSSPSTTSTKCAAPRSRSRARSSGACPGEATSRWWKEEREGVFIDYNQNARDRTVASAYSVRAVPDARVSCPLEWDEVADVEPGRVAHRHGPGTPARARRPGRRRSTTTPARSDSLLELAARDEREGLGDAPWPPHFRKQPGEPRRVQPSRAAGDSRRSRMRRGQARERRVIRRRRPRRLADRA